MRKIFLSIFLVLINYLYANNIVKHRDINSTIERLDVQVWDSLYYQYKLVNNIPYQYNKNKKTYFWNPIYPIFFYKDYIRKYKKTGKIVYLENIEKLTAAIIIKSDTFKYENNKVRTFYYSPSGDVSRMFHKHYSGLTNSYYVNLFSQLYKITNDKKYKEYAIEFFNSLTVPIQSGGVMYRNNNLISIAEVPMKPNGWILNGWLSSIVSIDQANKILKNNRILDFIRKNIKTLNKVLPLYNVEKLCISRYNLSQFFYFRILTKDYKIKKVEFIYPLDTNVSLSTLNNIGKKQSRWQPYILNKGNIIIQDNLFIGKKIFQFNGVLTLSGYPKMNEIKIEFAQDSLTNKKIKFQVYIGEYDPLHSSAVNRRWMDVDNVIIKDNILIVKLPYELFNDTIGYPTNFMKKFIDGRRNTYHDIHIKWLRYLGERYHQKEFLKFSDKWLTCKIKWKDINSYDNLFKNNKVLLDNEFLNFLEKNYK